MLKGLLSKNEKKVDVGFEMRKKFLGAVFILDEMIMNGFTFTRRKIAVDEFHFIDFDFIE